LARQGGTIHAPGKDDIDLSVWDADIGLLQALGEELAQHGYQQERWFWRGLPFKHKFFLPDDPTSYPVDFKIYRRVGEECWTPLVYHRRVRTKPLWLAARALRERSERAGSERQLGRWALGLWIGVHTFVVPARHFDELEPWLDTPLLMPSDLEGLLELHYGDWRTPVSPWDSAVQDGAVRQGPPARVLGASVLQKRATTQSSSRA
jgi:hypothetical protein